MKGIDQNFAPERILVIQLRQIGDVLLTTPALAALRSRFPQARISFLAEPLPAKVLEGNPDLDEIIIRDPREGGLEPLRALARVRRGRFDLVIDFLANPRTTLMTLVSGAKVTVSYADNRRSRFYTHPVMPEGTYAAAQKLSLLRVLGATGDPARLRMVPSESARAKVREWAQAQGLDARPGPRVALEPFMKWDALTYPAAEFAKVCGLMAEKWGATVIVCWGPGKEAAAREIVEKAGPNTLLAPATDLHELAALYGLADLWVGVDGGPRHVAASQGLPTFAVIGPSNDAWTPPGPRHLSVAHPDLACVPCNRRVCPAKHNKCMTEFPAAAVFARLDVFCRGLGLRAP